MLHQPGCNSAMCVLLGAVLPLCTEVLLEIPLGLDVIIVLSDLIEYVGDHNT